MTTYTDNNGRQILNYNTKETAAAIRAALKQTFPGVTFSVRISNYSMGSSTYVSWTDGPTDPEVRLVTELYTSQSFDGMTDSTNYHYQQRDGHAVKYSGYVSTSRKISDNLRALAARRAELLGIDNVWSVLHTMRPNGVRVILKEGR